jgi:hypothetical protein
MDTEPARESTVDTPSENDVVDEPAADIEEPTDETSMPAEEDTAERVLDRSPMNEKPGPVDKFSSKYPTKQGDTVEPVVDWLADCHPYYFHVRMYVHRLCSFKSILQVVIESSPKIGPDN